jgi:hypothetical protein
MEKHNTINKLSIENVLESEKWTYNVLKDIKLKGRTR